MMISSNEIVDIIKSLNPTFEITADTQLLKEGVLDSLTIMNLAILIKERFGTEISIFDITPENFATSQSIADLLNKKASNIT